MNKVYGFPSDLAAARDPSYPSGEYHIVAVKKGDCVRGYRIRHDEGNRSRYRGAMVYTLEVARELREFYRRNDNTAHTSFELVE